jgi:hypothetical protein
LEYWKTLARADEPMTYLVYGGDDSYTRDGTEVVGSLTHHWIPADFQFGAPFQ